MQAQQLVVPAGVSQHGIGNRDCLALVKLPTPLPCAGFVQGRPKCHHQTDNDSLSSCTGHLKENHMQVARVIRTKAEFRAKRVAFARDIVDLGLRAHVERLDDLRLA